MGDSTNPPKTADRNNMAAQNVFEKEVVLTEKEIMRNRLLTDREGMKEVFMILCYL
jgi:hypothetical protein